MPMGEYANFDACVTSHVQKGHSEESAKKMCGTIKAKVEGGHEEKQITYSYLGGVQFKEEEGEFYSEGFIATTHPDRAENGKYKGDILTKKAVSGIVDQINSRTGFMADLASYRHDWVKENDPNKPVAGRAVQAEVREMANGHYGAWVKTHHNKNHPKSGEIVYEVKNGYLPGYSIEYISKKTDDAMLSNGKYRLIDDLDLKGYGFASGRLIANPQATIASFGYKEIMEAQNNNINKNEVTKMSEEANMVVNSLSHQENKIDEKELADFRKFQEMKIKEQKMEEIRILVKESLLSVLPETKVKINTNTELKEINFSIEFKEWAAINNEEVSVKEAFSRANAFAKKSGAFDKSYEKFYGVGSFWGTPKPIEFKTTGVLGNKIEIKALTTTSNQSTDTDYLQSAAELSDIYAPAVAKMLNQKTTWFGLLPKEDWSGREGITWRAENVANASASSYLEGAAITTGQTTRQKLREEFKYYKVGIQVTGQMIESAKSGVGDAFGVEVEAATRRLITLMNTELFGTNGLSTDAGFLGLEYIATSTTYTTLYGLTRSTTNLLGASNSEFAAQSSAEISKPTLRTAIRTLEVNGADRMSLVVVCHPLQRDEILALLDDAQRFNSTMPRAGFEGMPTFDGVPIHSDKDANNDDIFVANLGVNGMRLAVQVPVRFEDLAKTDDSRRGFLKFYGNQYAIAPKQALYMIQGLSTS